MDSKETNTTTADESVDDTQVTQTVEAVRDMAEAATFARRARVMDGDILTRTVMRNLAYASDVAARTRKLRTIGYESTDVLSKVSADLLEEAATTGTTDTSPGRIARLCHNYAESLMRISRKEVASGDATDVVGETEHKADEAYTDADGGERQKRAVIGRKPRMSGIRRADPYAISDYSRDNMRAADIRYIVDTEREVVREWMERPFTPTRPREAEVLDQVMVDNVLLPDILLEAYKPLVLRKRTERVKTSYVDDDLKLVESVVKHKPGEVRKWRTIRWSDLADIPADQKALSQAVRTWASQKDSVIRRFWEQDGADQTMRAEVGAFLMDRDKVGEGCITPYPLTRFPDTAWTLKGDYSDESGKAARRWAWFADQDFSSLTDTPYAIEHFVWDPANRQRLLMHREWVIECLSALNTQRWLQLGRVLIPALCNMRNQ